MNIEVEHGQNSEVTLWAPEQILPRMFELEQFLAPAFEVSAGEIAAIDALILAAEGKAFLFVGGGNSTIIAAMICEFVQYPRKRVCNVLAYAGCARKFYSFFPKLKVWAKENGAQSVRGYGHEPQMRLARRHGLEEIYRVYEVNL